jgi:hypothetical protein
MDRIEIYQKLISIKPFFEQVQKKKKIIKTKREATLTRGAGNVFFETGTSGGATKKLIHDHAIMWLY